MAERGEPRAVRIDGCHYWIGEESPSTPNNQRGYYGKKFIIEFFDKKRGRIKTTNLWLNGTIPERFRDRLEDNAKFIV